MTESTLPTCLLCGSDTRPDGSQDWRKHTDWAQCLSCGFSQIYPMPTEEELIDVYASGDYRNFTGVCLDGVWAPYHPHDENGTLWGKQRQTQEWHRISNWCKEDGPLIDSRGKSYLDVGASTGESVRFMKARGMEPSHGVEPGTWGREWDAFETLDDVENSYDIVTCLHVLEHVNDPAKLLHQLLSKTNIQLCLEVPVGNKRLWPHVGDFTEGAFREWIRREGHQPKIYVEGIYLRCAIDVS